MCYKLLRCATVGRCVKLIVLFILMHTILLCILFVINILVLVLYFDTTYAYYFIIHFSCYYYTCTSTLFWYNLSWYYNHTCFYLPQLTGFIILFRRIDPELYLISLCFAIKILGKTYFILNCIFVVNIYIHSAKKVLHTWDICVIKRELLYLWICFIYHLKQLILNKQEKTE